MDTNSSAGQRIAIVGSGGRLGAALARAYGKDFEVIGFNHAQLDISDADGIRDALFERDFDVLINCAAQTNVDRCETHREEALALNAEAPRVLAEIANSKDAKLIHISTDYVFDGAATDPYREGDEARAISVYGESKFAGERHVLAANDEHLVARVSWVFGPDRPSFIDAFLERAGEQEEAAAVSDKFSTPTYTLDFATMLRPFLEKDFPGGLLHLTNGGACNWQEYAQHALDCAHRLGVPLKARTVSPLKLADMQNFVARRPPFTVMSTTRYEQLTGSVPRPWQDAVADFVRAKFKR